MINVCTDKANIIINYMYFKRGHSYQPPRRELAEIVQLSSFDQLVHEDMMRYEEMRQVILPCGLSCDAIEEDTIHTMVGNSLQSKDRYEDFDYKEKDKTGLRSEIRDETQTGDVFRNFEFINTRGAISAGI